MKWTMDKCTAIFSSMTEEELEIIDRVHESKNHLSDIQLLNKVNQYLLSKENRKENLIEAAALIIEAVNKGEIKGYKEINTKFFNLHFTYPEDDGIYRPKGMFYCAYEDGYEKKIVHFAVDNRKGNGKCKECESKEEAIETLVKWRNEV